MNARSQAIVDAITKAANEKARPLNDDEYIEVMDALASYFDENAQAKRDEL